MSADHKDVTRDPLRVLVADDDPILRSLMRARLVRFNGHAVDAEDGLAAWTLLCSQTFDIAIVDLGMPNLDGISLIQCMRGYPRTRHLPSSSLPRRTTEHQLTGLSRSGLPHS